MNEVPTRVLLKSQVLLVLHYVNCKTVTSVPKDHKAFKMSTTVCQLT